MPISKDPIKRQKQIAQLHPIKKGEKNKFAKGREKAPFKKFIEQLEAEVGVIPDVRSIQKMMLALPIMSEEQLKSIAMDKEQSMILRILSKSVLSPDGYKVVMDIIQRTMGNKLDITSNGEKIKNEPLIIEIIDKADQVEPTSTDEENDTQESEEYGF